MLTRISGPSAPVVSLAEIRAQARLDDENNQEDALLTAYVRASTDWIEQQLGVVLLTSTWEARVAGFPSGFAPALRLPIGPLQSVEQIVYLNTEGVTTVLPTASYDLANQKIWPAYGLSWPTVRSPSDVVISFTAGYGADHNSVPEPIRQAVMLLATWYYEMRVAAVDPAVAIPFGVTELLQPYRAWAF